MILVDSSVWIDHLNEAATDAVRRLRGYVDAAPLLVGDLILCEVLRGFRSDREATLVERQMRQFPMVALCDPLLAMQAATHYRFLRSRGITIRTTIDLIVATFCVERGHSLLHSDRDFEPMERLLGLQVA
jgi:predicted nucleic acid-binding protein